MFNVTCPPADLSEAVQIVARGVTGRSTQPVQNNIYLESTGQQMRLVATDMELISIESRIDVAVGDEGTVTAPARLLTEIVGSLPDADVALTADEQNALSVTCGSVEYSIQGLPAADFQMFAPIEEGITANMPQSLIHSVLAQTTFATSGDETRPILTGALFEFSPDSVQVVATDTYRLALRKAQMDLDIEEPMSVIVSGRALDELTRVTSADSDEPVTMTVSANQIEFEIGTLKLASRLIEGQFPNYEKVIPDEHERTITVGVAALEPALRRALIVAREDANRIVLKPSESKLQITAESQDVGRTSEEVPANLEGETTEIAFNGRYLLDLLEAADSEQIIMNLAGPLNPGTIRLSDNEDYLYVLMPMQIM